MKKIATVLSLVLILSCSTNNDSNGNSATTVVPIAPTNLSGTAVSTSQINLSWTDNSTNETGFKIERITEAGEIFLVGTVNADVLTFSDSGLTSNATYIYRVYSFNSAGNSVYSNEFSVTTLNLPVTDLDGNVYQTVTIGNQVWSQTNLNVSQYKNGDVIPQVTDPTAWKNLTTGAWCYYNNDPANGAIYGKLYNWYAVNDPRGLVPSGYHIPTDAEWTTLTDYLGGENVAGNIMKSAQGWTPNAGIVNTNSSGFTGLPGGLRIVGGPFSGTGNTGWWWSSSIESSQSSWYRVMNFSNSSVKRLWHFKYLGMSVRFIKD